MIADGLLGEIRIVNMQFAHGFITKAVELQAESTRWRVTPKFAGPSYVLGDLATHPLFVAETMAPQLNIKRLMCSRQSFVPSRAPLEDNAFVLMEYDNGAVGSMWTSAVNSGAMHSQKCASSAKKQASNGGMSILTSSAMRCRASRRAFWNVGCPTCRRTRWRMTALAAAIRKGCSKPGQPLSPLCAGD